MTAFAIRVQVGPIEPEARRQVIEIRIKRRLGIRQAREPAEQHTQYGKTAHHCSAFKSEKEVVR